MAPLVVGYWKIRGLGAPVRMLCEYAGVEYEAKLYEIQAKPEGGWDMTEWLTAKDELKMKNALMNLPYVVDGDEVVTQSVAVLSYLGKKFGLYGSSPMNVTKIDQVLCEAQDLRNACIQTFYSRGKDKDERMKLLDKARTSYDKFDLWLTQQGTRYTAGDTPTAGDFHLWELVDQLEMMAKDTGVATPLNDFHKVKALYEGIKTEPKLAKYFASDLYKLPPNNKMAGWGGGEPEEWAKRFG